MVGLLYRLEIADCIAFINKSHTNYKFLSLFMKELNDHLMGGVLGDPDANN